MKRMSVLALLALMASILVFNCTAPTTVSAEKGQVCDGIAIAIVRLKPGPGFDALLRQAIDLNCGVAKDIAGLRILYSSTNGNSWSNHNNWTTSLDHCTWFGVSCDSTRRVTALTLGQNNLTGTLPPALGLLTSLRNMDLSNNHLTGSIPAEIGKLISLADLNLARNQLTGPLPAAIGNLISLVTLDISLNQLNGSLPSQIGSLACLNSLVLSNNQLSGPIPVEIGNISHLNKLGMTNNQLTGAIPAEMGNLASLVTLDLSYNNLSGPIPANIGNLSSLTHLVLERNRLNGSMPSELGNLLSLVSMDISNNLLTGPIPAEIVNPSQLEALDLSVNRLNGSIPDVLFKHSALRTLNLSSNWLSGTLPILSEEQSVLIILDLMNNQLSGTLPAELSYFKKIQLLNLSINQFTGTIPIEFGTMTSLRDLRLFFNPGLFGGLPVSMTAVPLYIFQYAGTGICEPNNTALRNWLNQVPFTNRTNITCNMPVIVIPGVTGSQLYNDASNCSLLDLQPNGNVWVSFNTLLAMANHTLELKAESPAPVVACDNIYASPANDLYGVLDQYKDLVLNLEDAGNTVRFFPFDWRLSIEVNAERLDSQMAAWGFQNEKVMLVGHSMGGLLANTYVRQHPEKVAKVITIGSPYLGAPKQAMAMRVGDLPVPIALPFGVSAKSVADIIRNAPGMLELLPSEAFFEEIDYYYLHDGTPLDTWEDTRNFFATDSGLYGTQNGRLIDEARDYHRIYDNFSQITTEYHVLAASNNPTLMVIDEANCFLDWFCIWNLGTWEYGDGTVPLISAWNLGSYRMNVHVHPAYIPSQTTATHGDLVKDPLVLAQVRNILLGTLDEPVVQSLEMAEPVPQKLVQLTVRGMGKVSVTDMAGNTITEATSGASVNAIPGVTVERIGNQVDIVLPANQPYTVTLTEAGDMPRIVIVSELTSVKGDGIFTASRRVIFNDLSLSAEGFATLNLDLSNGIDSLSIAVDQDGDGQIDQTVLPAP